MNVKILQSELLKSPGGFVNFVEPGGDEFSILFVKTHHGVNLIEYLENVLFFISGVPNDIELGFYEVTHELADPQHKVLLINIIVKLIPIQFL